jgi:hypothetical protein
LINVRALLLGSRNTECELESFGKKISTGDTEIGIGVCHYAAAFAAPLKNGPDARSQYVSELANC